MPRLIQEPIFCPKCSTRIHLRWWDDIKARIYRVRCPECRSCRDYRILPVCHDDSCYPLDLFEIINRIGYLPRKRKRERAPSCQD